MTEDVQGQRSGAAVPGAPPRTRRRLTAALAVGATVAVAALGVPMALAGQHRADPAAAAVAATPTPFVEGRPPSLPPRAEQPEPGPPPTGAAGVKGMPAEDGCPVHASRLLTALRASDLHQRLAASAEPEELADIDCYATYALARTAPAAAGGGATVVFRYSELTGSWRVIGGGTATPCRDVPQSVRARLELCR
ncbi:hypothetical protein [Actinoplanes sp. NPDC049599]|uniref:hypothetical protein n=1 Tax=Actinoplanes sp. NPDC049599 TaxID=3363903 RepID=UPI0037A25992